MSHFSEIDFANPVSPDEYPVLRTIVIEPGVLATGKWGDPTNWRQTSYRTRGGEHPEGKPLRKNYAGPGMIYNARLDAFYARRPYPSWLLNERSCLWQAPVPMLADGKNYAWDEASKTWKEALLATLPAPPVTA